MVRNVKPELIYFHN